VLKTNIKSQKKMLEFIQ